MYGEKSLLICTQPQYTRGGFVIEVDDDDEMDEVDSLRLLLVVGDGPAAGGDNWGGGGGAAARPSVSERTLGDTDDAVCVDGGAGVGAPWTLAIIGTSLNGTERVNLVCLSRYGFMIVRTRTFTVNHAFNCCLLLQRRQTISFTSLKSLSYERTPLYFRLSRNVSPMALLSFGTNSRWLFSSDER